jgi:ornithine cyclodeaminase
MPSTLLLTQTEIEMLLDDDELLEQLKVGFAALAKAGPEFRGRRFPVALNAADSDAAGMVLAPGLIPGIPAYTVKVNAKFPSQPPAIKGLVILHSLHDGAMLALLDSGYLTARRTAAAGAVGADTLARPDSETVSIIGCGVQGYAQLAWMLKIRPIKNVFLYDTVPAQVQAFAKRALSEFDVPVEICDSAKQSAGKGDIVVTATWAREPFLSCGDVRPGTHITTLGPDGPGEAEVAADLLAASLFFADDADLQVEMGAIGGTGLGAEAIRATIGEVLGGQKTGRKSPDDITIYGMVGLPFEDLAASWLVYNKALKSGVGTEVDLAA